MSLLVLVLDVSFTCGGGISAQTRWSRGVCVAQSGISWAQPDLMSLPRPLTEPASQQPMATIFISLKDRYADVLGVAFYDWAGPAGGPMRAQRLAPHRRPLNRSPIM